MRDSLKIDATKWQYTHGARDPTRISPDTWTIDQALLDRPGNKEIQLKLFLDYGSNPPLYPQWQAYFRKYQPPTLIVWGKNDQIFPVEGAEPYKRDLKISRSTCSTPDTSRSKKTETLSQSASETSSPREKSSN